MSKRFDLGTLDADGSLTLQVDHMSASQFSLILDGDPDSGTVAFTGSADGVNFYPIMLTNPFDASVHNAIEATLVGHYTFNALCAFLRFTLSGSGSPDLTMTLFPEPRS